MKSVFAYKNSNHLRLSDYTKKYHKMYPMTPKEEWVQIPSRLGLECNYPSIVRQVTLAEITYD